MLLSKTIIAVIVAAAAGGIVIGSATTYVVVNQQASACNDGFVPEVTKQDLEKAKALVGGHSLTGYRIKKPHE